MTLGTTLPYGLRDVKITPYTTGETLASTTIDLPNSRTFSFAEAEDFDELRGDDGVVTVRGKGPGVNWALEGGGVSFEVVQAMYGGTITSSGTTPAQVKTFRKLQTDIASVLQGRGSGHFGQRWRLPRHPVQVPRDRRLQRRHGGLYVPPHGRRWSGHRSADRDHWAAGSSDRNHLRPRPERNRSRTHVTPTGKGALGCRPPLARQPRRPPQPSAPQRNADLPGSGVAALSNEIELNLPSGATCLD
jgi:hypothetical protein